MLNDEQQIGRYRIVSALGAGGMGEVFLAEDIRLRRKVALKVLPEKFASDKERMFRFEREAFAASALNHPNILTIYEFDNIDNTHFLASEYINGETLSERMQQGSLSMSEILNISVQIISALQAAHQAGIIHRDIKPDNVMIREDDIVKVLDFGLAKLLEQSQVDEESETKMQVQTKAGMVMGTVAYMSPEQARGALVDARTDIFSFGVLLYKMLTGEQPFTGETINHTIVAILEKEPPTLSQFVNDYPLEIENIIFKCLAKNPNDRYQSAKDLLVDLKSLQKNWDFETELKRTSQPKEQAEADTQIIKAQTDSELVKPTEFQETPPVRISFNKKSKYRWVPLTGGVLLILISAITYLLINSTSSLIEQKKANQNNADEGLSSPLRFGKRYLEMSDTEKQQFVSTEADKILQIIKSEPESEITPKGKESIKSFVDNYAKRSRYEKNDSCGSKTFFQSDLKSMLKRGVKIAPDIIAGFKERDIPVQIGIYLAMNESEFCPCLIATGGLGIYQFSTQTAIDYGLKAVQGANADSPDERCNPEPASLAAASYMKKLMAEDFGNGLNQSTFAIAAYNSGENGLREDINKTKNKLKNDTISYWNLLDNSEKLSEEFKSENSKYVPRFFASAIVGENPKVFDIDLQPLSSYVK